MYGQLQVTAVFKIIQILGIRGMLNVIKVKYVDGEPLFESKQGDIIPFNSLLYKENEVLKGGYSVITIEGNLVLLELDTTQEVFGLLKNYGGAPY